MKRIAYAVMALAIYAGPASAGSVPPVSVPHRIDCFDQHGNVVRSYENDTAGRYYNRAGAASFLDKKDGRMKRITLANCEESWNPKDGDY